MTKAFKDLSEKLKKESMTAILTEPCFVDSGIAVLANTNNPKDLVSIKNIAVHPTFGSSVSVGLSVIESQLCLADAEKERIKLGYGEGCFVTIGKLGYLYLSESGWQETSENGPFCE